MFRQIEKFIRFFFSYIVINRFCIFGNVFRYDFLNFFQIFYMNICTIFTLIKRSYIIISFVFLSTNWNTFFLSFSLLVYFLFDRILFFRWHVCSIWSVLSGPFSPNPLICFALFSSLLLWFSSSFFVLLLLFWLSLILFENKWSPISFSSTIGTTSSIFLKCRCSFVYIYMYFLFL